MVATVDLYRASFARRSAAMSNAQQVVLNQPGICGVVGSAQHPGGRVLITDDRARSWLAEQLPDLSVQIMIVSAEAPQCRGQIEQAGHWDGEPATAMICRDLGGLPAPSLPSGLTIRPVARTPSDATNGVPLEQAAQACLQADPTTAGHPLQGFLGFLRSLPASTRLLAAVDDHNVVRATAGASALGEDANAYFVSTHPDWRRQGVATAMTAAALTWAHEAGARRACLDASPAGLSIYLRLGFETIGPVTLFARFT